MSLVPRPLNFDKSRHSAYGNRVRTYPIKEIANNFKCKAPSIPLIDKRCINDRWTRKAFELSPQSGQWSGPFLQKATGYRSSSPD